MLTEQTPDSVLWNEVQKNNSNAFALLFKRYWSAAFTSAFAHLKDKGACADLVQDTFLSIWGRRHNLAIDSFKPYLQASTRYHVYRFMRAKRVSPMFYTDDFSKVTLDTGHMIQSPEVSTFELQKEIDQFLVRLPKRCREIFCLSRKENLSNDEIAILLEISKRTVENQLTHALREIRILLRHVPGDFVQ
jgi:RNA polymerase sigma-70 factor (ECF subfamily)